jgi:hypothetical protein
VFVRRTTTTAETSRLLVRFAPFLLLVPPPSAAIEARRGTAEGSSPATQTRGRAAAGRVGGVVRGPGVVMPVSMMVTVVHAEDVAVVGGAAGRVGEDGVGLGEEGEGVRGVWVGGIGVGMVGFGEGVEGPEELSVRAVSCCL